MDEKLINQIEEEYENIIYETAIEREEETVIDISESMGWVGGDNRYHDSLLGIDFPRQHPITAITNLREELDEIEKLKTVYSDGFNVANYYKWKDAAYDTYGYFVSVVDGDRIQICNGSDIFGVVVQGGVSPDAGFIGGQDATVPRDNKYGLVVTSGLVDIRCELGVQTGDCVVSNISGYAKKSESNYGYRVLGTETKDGEPYAIIALGVQADMIDAIGADLNITKEQVDANYKNIISAVNVANQAYNKAVEAEVSNQTMSGQVNNMLGVVDGLEGDVVNLGEQVSSSAQVATQAKAIAESAATSVESMRNEAVAKANEALVDTSELRDDFASMEEGIKEIENQISIIVKENNDQNTTIAGIRVDVNNHEAKINNLVSWQGDTNIAMARIEQKADANGAYIQSTVSNMDKYAVGPYSQAYGFTMSQASKVLEEGMMYVPANKTPTDMSEIEEEYKATTEPLQWFEDDEENGVIKDINDVYYTSTTDADGKSTITYWHYDYVDGEFKWISSTDIPTYTRKFMPTYLYKWGKLRGVGPYRWITVDKFYNDTDVTNTSTPAVHFQTVDVPSIGDNDNFGYWYTNGSTLTGTAAGYESYTLYKWISGTNAAEDEPQWVAVATLAGNSSNRAVSQIRQDANSIELSVTTLDGKYAGTKAFIDDNQSVLQDVVSWKGENGENIATFATNAGDNFASASQVAKIVDADGNINAASIVTAVNNAGSSVVIEADHINLQGHVTVGDLSDNVKENMVSSSVIYYGLSDSETIEPTEWIDAENWNKGENTWTTGKYTWQKTVVTKANGTTAVTKACIQGARGEQGPQGIQGPQGAQGLQGIQGEKGEQGIQGEAGQTSYFHIKYSANEDGSDMTETPSTYIGTYVDYTATDSADPSDYTWSRFEGVQGEKGDQGIPGTNGENGKTSYLHIKYSNVANPTSSEQINDNGGDYIGQYTDFEQADSTDPSKYTWVKIKGDQGPQGVGIKKIDTHIRNFTASAWRGYGESGKTVNWDTGLSYDNSHIKVGDTAYIVGVVTDATGTNGVSVDATIYGVVTAITSSQITMTSSCLIMGGQKGSQGVSVVSVVPQYCVSTDNANPPGSDWTDDFDKVLQTYYANKRENSQTPYYIWSQERVKYNDGGTTYSTATVNGASSMIASWCDENDTTKINGGNIATGSIIAASINTTGLQAEYIEVKDTDGNTLFKANTADNEVEMSAANITGTLKANQVSVSDLNAFNATIAGWKVTEDAIEKRDDNGNSLVGMYSGEDREHFSAVGEDPSPIRFYAGADPDIMSETIRQQTLNLTPTVTGETLTHTIALSGEEQWRYDIISAECLTSTQHHTITCEYAEENCSFTETNTGTSTSYRWSKIITLLPTWVETCEIKATCSLSRATVSATYKGNGQVQVLVSNSTKPGSTVNVKVNVSATYEFVEDLNVNVTHDSKSITVALYPQTTEAYNIDVQYTLKEKCPKFMILEDGSLYASAARIEGTIYAADGEFTGWIDATGGNIGAFEITNDGLSSEYINLNSTSIYFPTQASFNLANYVTIFHDSIEDVSYIATSGDRDFEIKNMGGAGIRFKADEENEKVTQTATITHRYVKGTTQYGYTVYLNYVISDSGTLLTPYETIIYYKEGSTTKSLSVTIPANSNSGTCSSQITYNGSTYKSFGGISLSSTGTFGGSVSIVTVNVNTTNNILYSLGSFCPNITATESGGYLLGDANHLWRNLTAYSAAITTSDRNEKHDIKYISDELESFYDELRPVSFVYNNSDSDRTHMGFIAQDVEDSLVKYNINTKDFAGICIDENKDTGVKKYFLRYEEFIPLNTLEIQKLKKRVAELEAKLTTQQND